MRLVLKSGKQKELIELAKKEKTWNELAKSLNINPVYLCHDLRLEKILVSQEIYNKLCNITQHNFDKFILEEREDNWGKAKGGINSPGSTINIKIPQENEDLAEIVGAILGDGHIMFHKKGKKIGVYQINITGHKELDKDYHLNYLRKKFKSLFNINTKEVLARKSNGRHLIIYSRELVNFFINMGLKSGDKIQNQTTIPHWIFKETKYLRVCVRGLIDTDGSVFRMSRRDSNLIRIGFTNHDRTLLNDTREAFIQLGFHPSKIIKNRTFCISKQNEIAKYLKEVGFSNKKHKDRLRQFKAP